MREPTDDTEYLRGFTVYFLPSFFFFGGCTDCTATAASDVRLKNTLLRDAYQVTGQIV